MYSKAAEFLASISTSADADTRESENPAKRRRWQRWHARVKPLEEFHAAPAYAGDLHRADMAWAKHAAGCGLTLEQIRNELLNGRNLSKKGGRMRQLEYAERTARKAIEQASVRHL